MAATDAIAAPDESSTVRISPPRPTAGAYFQQASQERYVVSPLLKVVALEECKSPVYARREALILGILPGGV